MSMNVGGSRGAVISSINVTPMADVIIVLLIIFMVTIPVITRGEVDLPDASQAAARKDAPIVVTMQRGGSVVLSGHGAVALSELSERLRGLGAAGGVVHVRADQDLSYENVAPLLAACRDAGADGVVVMTEEPLASR